MIAADGRMEPGGIVFATIRASEGRMVLPIIHGGQPVGDGRHLTADESLRHQCHVVLAADGTRVDGLGHCQKEEMVPKTGLEQWPDELPKQPVGCDNLL